MNLRQGTLLKHGEYRIECELGHGGFGVTYLAVQVGLNRRVAIKEFFMSEYCNRDAETSHVSVPSEGSKELVAKFRNKFVKEAQNIASLKHPHIISIHDVFEDNGTAYYVMEYLDHGSLADVVKHQGRLPEADALRYTREIADALRYIHARKMNHLDVKPGNILIDEEDHAVLIDFGLSKRYDDEGNQTSTTPVGISHGYAPLEQYKKGGVGTFSPATDIYSLGATLYKLITGATPPDANDILTDGLPAHPDVMSLPVYEAIEQAMQPNKNHRPQSVEAFLALLDVPAAPASETEKEEDVPTEVIAEEPASVDDDNTSYPLRFEEESPMEMDSADITVPSPRTKSSFSPKKHLWSLLACVVAVGIFFGVRACNDYRAEAARLAEIEQLRLDSIAKVEEDVEKAKQAQLEQQRKDSIAKAEAKSREAENTDKKEDDVEEDKLQTPSTSKSEQKENAKQSKPAQESQTDKFSTAPAEEENTVEEENTKSSSASKGEQDKAEDKNVNTAPKISSEIYARFFPVHGVWLGKTTISDVESLGYTVHTEKNGVHKYTKINDIEFYDRYSDSIFEGLYMSVRYMPDRWRDLGFDPSLSYDEWTALLKELGFHIWVRKSPKVEKDGKRKTLVGEFTATAPDGTFSMTFYFKWGNRNGEGYRTDSKNSLNSMDVSIDRWYSPFESE